MPIDKQQADAHIYIHTDEHLSFLFFFIVYIGQSFVKGTRSFFFQTKEITDLPDTCKSFLDKRQGTEGPSFIISNLFDRNE